MRDAIQELVWLARATCSPLCPGNGILRPGSLIVEAGRHEAQPRTLDSRSSPSWAESRRGTTVKDARLSLDDVDTNPPGKASVFSSPVRIKYWNMSARNIHPANKLSIVSTLVDAAVSFSRGRKKSGLLLLGAAALSSRLPGLGTAVSVFLRIARRLR